MASGVLTRESEMDHAKSILRQRTRRRHRVRKPLRGTSERPRLSVRRSHKHIYAQVIDDASGKTVVAAATVETQIKSGVDFGGIATPLLPSVRLLPNGRKQQGYHESVLIVVRVGITVVLQPWLRSCT